MTCPRFFAAVGAWVLFAAGLLASPAHAAPPTFQAVSAIASAASGSGDPTVTLPGHAANDVFLLATIVRSNTATVATPAGWTQIGSPTVRSTVATYQFFWKRAAGGSETNPVIDRTGTTGDVYAAVISYRGAITTGDPWEVKGTPATGTTDPATCTGITTLSADSLVVAALAGEDNNNGAVTTTGTDPAAYAEHYDDSGTGADGMIAFSEATRTTAGLTGNVSVNFDNGNPVGWGCVVLALIPPPAPTLSSAANQTFTIGDPPTLASTLTVTDHTTTLFITAANDIRIRIPATFNMTWDTTVTTVTLGGGAAGKVSATLSAYEDSNRTAVLNVTSNFAASDQLTIAGLKFRNFTATSAADNLELVVAGSGGTTADEDDKTITIVSSGVTSAGSRILNDNAGRTPVAAEDVDVTNWNKSTKFLVTIGIQTASGARCRNNQGTNKLQWRNVTDAPGTWNNLGTAAGPEMRLFDSANLAHANDLTSAEAQITGTGTWNDGEEAESSADISWGSDIRNGEHSAIQFPIDPSGGIDGKTYQFRFIVNPSGLCDAGSSIMSVSVTLAAPVPAPGSFNAFETSTAANATSGQVYTKRSSISFALDVVAILSGAQHASFTDTAQVDLVTGSSGGANCPGTPVSVATAQSVNLTNGRGTTGSFNVASAYPDVRVRIRYPVSSPTVTSCSTDNFSIRPSGITVTSTNATNNATTGTPAIKTGANFNLTAATGVALYNGTPTVDNNPGMVIGSPNAGTIGGSFGAGDATGTATGNAFFYSEVGNFGLSANAVRDTSFTAVDQPNDCTADSSNALVGGKYGCYFGSTLIPMTVGSSGFGRFIPDNFNVTYNTPTFTTYCGGASGFTYVGQSLPYTVAPQMTITARSGTANGLTNTTTTNYAGAYVRMANTGTSLNQAPYDTQNGRYARFDALGGGATPARDTSALPATTLDPSFGGGFTNGVATLTFASGLAFVRPTSPLASPAAPVAPFNADIALSLNIVDSDGVIFAANPAGFGQVVTAGGGIAFSGSKAMRFGFLRLENAVGSEKLDLPVTIQTQYYTGTTFTRNTDDNCTSISAANVAFSSYFGGITATNMNSANVTGLGAAFSSGFGSLTLTKPSPTPASAGAVTLTIDLTAEAKSYLKGNWGVLTYTADPSSRAAFGLYGGQPNNFIYFRENY